MVLRLGLVRYTESYVTVARISMRSRNALTGRCCIVSPTLRASERPAFYQTEPLEHAIAKGFGSNIGIKLSRNVFHRLRHVKHSSLRAKQFHKDPFVIVLIAHSLVLRFLVANHLQSHR